MYALTFPDTFTTAGIQPKLFFLSPFPSFLFRVDQCNRQRSDTSPSSLDDGTVSKVSRSASVQCQYRYQSRASSNPISTCTNPALLPSHRNFIGATVRSSHLTSLVLPVNRDPSRSLVGVGVVEGNNLPRCSRRRTSSRMVRITKPSLAAKTLGIPLTTSKNGKYRRATAGSCKATHSIRKPRFHGYERNTTTKVTLFQEVNTILSAPAQDITVPQCNTPFSALLSI
jgi:hypothetical protein